MGSGIHVGYMTKTYAAFLKSSGTRQDGQSIRPGSFCSAAERIAQKAAEYGGPSGACDDDDSPAPGRFCGNAKCGPGEQAGISGGNRTAAAWLAERGDIDQAGKKENTVISADSAAAAEKLSKERKAEGFVQDMTLDEYKLYISDRIAQLPTDPSRAGWSWYIDITEAGYEAMKNDPDYEAHVLDDIRRNFAVPDPFHSSTLSILHFGASEEDSYGQSYSYDSPAEHLQDKEDSYWEKRKARRKKLQELLDDLAEKKAVARRQGLPEPTMPDINSILELLCADR